MENKNLDALLKIGNYNSLRKAARAVLTESSSSSQDRKKAEKYLHITGIDPVVIMVGFAATLLVSAVAVFVG